MMNVLRQVLNLFSTFETFTIRFSLIFLPTCGCVYIVGRSPTAWSCSRTAWRTRASRTRRPWCPRSAGASTPCAQTATSPPTTPSTSRPSAPAASCRSSCTTSDAPSAATPSTSSTTGRTTVAPPGGGKGGSFPLWVDVRKLCNMCVL